jgi:hypothetical protein
MDVRFVVLGLAAPTDGSDLLGLGDIGAGRYGNRAEVEQGDRIAVGRLDRDRAPVSRQRAGEANRACGRRERGSVGRTRDVDAPVLAGFVLRRGHDKGRQHGPGRRPAPRARRRRSQERDQDGTRDGDHCSCQSREHRQAS